MHYMGAALQSQQVAAPPKRGPAFESGYQLGYEDVAKQAKDSLGEYLADNDPHDALYERAVVAAEQSWTLHDGTRHEALGSEWLSGYWAGMQAFRADLIASPDDEDAEKRLLAAGVTL